MRPVPTLAPPRIVTFDFYTALVDYERSLVQVVRAACDDSVDAAALTRAWRAKQLEWAQLSNSLQRGRVPFRECTRRALVYTLARAGRSLPAAKTDALVAAWDSLVPWPEAPATLAEIRARGYPIAVMSNGDEAMLRAGAKGVGVAFDHFFASDRAGVYKPHPAMYALPAQTLGCAPAEVLHVAGSGIDAMGAKLAGLRCAWSNRGNEPPMSPQTPPDHEMRDLAGLLDILPRIKDPARS